MFKLMTYVAIFVVFLLFFYVLTRHFSVLKNISKSMPEKYYFSFPVGSVCKNDIVMFDHSAFVKPLIKRVVGIEGDTISIQKDKLYLNARFLCSVLEHDSRGTKLRPIKNTKIPQGYVFVLGDNDRSFDSRYEDVGLISVTKIKRKVIALL